MKTRPITLADVQPHLPLDGRRVNVDRESRRISVRVARFGETHSGFGPQVKVPRNANLDAAHVGTIDLADGSSLRGAVLPMDTSHAPANLAALHAASWYENSGKAVARGRYSADGDGIRFDGVLFDDIDEAKVDRLVAASASGDWRSAIALKSFGDFEHAPADFVGSCIVNIGGYADTYSPGEGRRLNLVASAAGDLISIEDATSPSGEGANRDQETDSMKWDGIERRKTATDAPNGESESLTAAGGGEGCNGESCDSCQGSCTTPAATDEPKVTITASALEALVEAAADAPEPAMTEALEVLTAGGHREQADPRDARLASLERMVIDIAFQGD